MKFNVEIDLDWLSDGYTIDELVKEELARHLSVVVGELLAKNDFERITRGEEFKAMQAAYNATVEDLKANAKQKREEVLAKVDTVFEEFLEGKAFSVNNWGQPTKEYTVGEFIQEQIGKKIDDFGKALTTLVNKRVDEALKLSERDIRNLVDVKAKEVQNENAKAVAEFIVKGLK